MMHPDPVLTIAVASGKGGVGKTNVSVNLSVAMARQGRRVLLMDADLGLANVDVMLGLQPKANLSHVLDGSCALEEVIITGPADLRIIPAASGVSRMADLSPAEHAGLIRAFGELRAPFDVLVIDTAAGVSDSVVSFTRAAQHVLVVVCDEPASITDAYALIKVLSKDHGIQNFHILANMVRGESQGRQLYGKLARVCDQFLDVVVRYLGAVPMDEKLRSAVQQQRCVVEVAPGAASARVFDRLSRIIADWNTPDGSRGHIEFFVERLLTA